MHFPTSKNTGFRKVNDQQWSFQNMYASCSRRSEYPDLWFLVSLFIEASRCPAGHRSGVCLWGGYRCLVSHVIRLYGRSMLCFCSSGRVSVSDMEEKILRCQRSGLSVFLVGITAGTTVLGAFDPIEEVAVLCQKYRIWLHVDVSNRTLSNGSLHLIRMPRVHGVVQHCSRRKPNTYFKASTSKTCLSIHSVFIHV